MGQIKWAQPIWKNFPANLQKLLFFDTLNDGLYNEEI